MRARLLWTSMPINCSVAGRAPERATRGEGGARPAATAAAAGVAAAEPNSSPKSADCERVCAAASATRQLKARPCSTRAILGWRSAVNGRTTPPLVPQVNLGVTLDADTCGPVSTRQTRPAPDARGLQWRRPAPPRAPALMTRPSARAPSRRHQAGTRPPGAPRLRPPAQRTRRPPAQTYSAAAPAAAGAPALGEHHAGRPTQQSHMLRGWRTLLVVSTSGAWVVPALYPAARLSSGRQRQA